MTPEERRLIAALFDRMQSYGAPEKDREAEGLIRERVRSMPDAVYMLTQSVLVQDQALQAANERVLELEDRVRQLEESQPPPRRSGGFLSGGFIGRGRDADAPPSSVPQVGARATPSSSDRPSAWGSPPPPSAPPPPQAGGGGGFMRSAMATAAGVAGGMLAAESIRNMLGGGHARAGEAGERHTFGDAERQRDEDRQQDLEQDRELERDEDRQQDLEQDRELEHDQGSDEDTGADDSFDSDGDDGMDV
jgi:uncharacterized protein